MLTTAPARLTWLHQVEPRAKLVAFFAVMAGVFMLERFVPLLALAAVLAVLLWRYGNPHILGRRFLYALLAGFPVTWIIFTVSQWEPNVPYWHNVSESSLASGSFFLRLVVIVFANLLVISTTDPREFARSLRGWYLPAEICLMLMTVLRFLPLAGEQARRIYDVQRCRGYRMSRLWLPSAWLPLCVPLLVSALHRAESLAISLELRGFSNGLLSLATPDRWQWREYLIAGGSLVLAAATWLLR